MPEGDNHINNAYPSHDVIRLYLFLRDPFTQALFSNLEINPNAVNQLNNDEIRKWIIDKLYEKEMQECLKNALKNLDKLKAALKDMGRIYDEHSSTPTPVFSQYTQNDAPAVEGNVTPPKNMHALLPENLSKSHKYAPGEADNPLAITIGDTMPLQTSDLIAKSATASDYKSKLLLIDTFSRYLFLSQLAPDKIDFTQPLKKHHVQHKVSEASKVLEDWERDLLSTEILNDYANNSRVLAMKLRAKNITQFSSFQKNIFEGMVEAYQSRNPSESDFLEHTLYYFSNIHNNTFFVPFRAFGAATDLPVELKDEVTAFIAMHDLLTAKKGGDEDTKNKHEQNRKKLMPKLIKYANSMLSRKSFVISDLLSKKRNLPGSHIKNVHGVAIPVTIFGIDPTLKRKAFKALFDTMDMNEKERIAWKTKGEIPRWFDVGCLVWGSSLQKTYTSDTENAKFQSIDISNGFTGAGNIYPVIVYHGTTIILHDLNQLQKIAHGSPVANIVPTQDDRAQIGDLLGEWVHNMLSFSPNIYRKEILERIPGNKKSEYKAKHNKDKK